jgi:hypothetical protein
VLQLCSLHIHLHWWNFIFNMKVSYWRFKIINFSSRPLWFSYTNVNTIRQNHNNVKMRQLGRFAGVTDQSSGSWRIINLIAIRTNFVHLLVYIGVNWALQKCKILQFIFTLFTPLVLRTLDKLFRPRIPEVHITQNMHILPINSSTNKYA